MKAAGIVCLFLFSLNACSLSQSKSSPSHIEVVELKGVFYETNEQHLSIPVMEHKQKVWFKDSFAIEEVTSLSIHEDEYNVTTISNTVLYYRFTNLKTRNSYHYLSFTDTAAIDTKFSLDDTARTIGGWGFKSSKHYSYKGQPQILSDTILKDVTYKRVKVMMGTEMLPQAIVYYCRCDKRNSFFNYNMLISEISGCPATMQENYTPLKDDLSYSSEIIFLADSLTEKEKKVFEAWQRNEVEHPVKRKGSN